MKKVLIFYASYGGGHLSAAKSIQEYINNNSEDTETELIDCMKYISKTIEKFSTAAYREMAKKFPWVWGKVYSDSQKGPLAHISSYSNQIMAVKLLKLLREKEPDLIISTHPFGSQMCTYLKRKGKISSKIVTVMTDFAPHDQWLVGADYTESLFVSNEDMKKSIVAKGVPSEKIFVTGIPISGRFSQSYDSSEILKNYHLEEGKKNILFFGGGEFGLGKEQTLETFKIFMEQLPDTQIFAISGKNEKLKEQFQNITKANHRENSVCILEFTDQVPEIMSICDFVVTKPGGLTVSESLVSGLPLFIISPIPGQEEENATFLEKQGVAVWLKKDSNLPKEILVIEQEPEKIARMKENVKLLAKPDATASICQIALETIKEDPIS